ncbi:MAG: hypothetical protein ACLFQ8_01655 [Candidatus Aenigmatarchaeota archaeon]
MIDFAPLLINVAISFVALYIGNRLISGRISYIKLLGIAASGQLFIIYALPYALTVTSMIPIARLDLIFEAIVWVGLVNFVVPKTTPKEYFILGILAFGVNYLIGYFELLSLI